MSLRTIEPRYQTTLISSSPRRYLTGEFVRSLPEEIRCCPKHSTMFVAVFVAIKRTESTRTFLYIQLSQQISIYRGTYAHATPCGCSLKIFFCVHEPYVPLLDKVLERKTPPTRLPGPHRRPAAGSSRRAAGGPHRRRIGPCGQAQPPVRGLEERPCLLCTPCRYQGLRELPSPCRFSARSPRLLLLACVISVG
jgi:hypothetical protein